MQIKTKIVSCYTADSQPVKQDVNGTVIVPHLGPGQALGGGLTWCYETDVQNLYTFSVAPCMKHEHSKYLLFH